VAFPALRYIFSGGLQIYKKKQYKIHFFQKKLKKSLSTDYQFLTPIYFTKTIFCRRRNGIFQFQNGIKIDFRGKKW